jgi:predicted regulator of Ras-like GTPase activity (Roadblock/LC7/MglB family)
MAANDAAGGTKSYMTTILDYLTLRAPETISAIIATRDGLSVASGLPNTTDREEDVVAVAAARILDMAHDISEQLEQGTLGRILIEGERRTTVVMGAGRDTVVAVVVPADAHLGRVMLAVRHAAQKLEQFFA